MYDKNTLGKIPVFLNDNNEIGFNLLKIEYNLYEFKLKDNVLYELNNMPKKTN